MAQTEIGDESIQQKAPDFTDRRLSDQTSSSQTTSSTQRDSTSYFARHWRGELSLPVSYWVNGSLGGAILYLLVTILPWDQFVSNSPRVYWTLAIGFSLFLVLTTIWQTVGIWRSANNYLGNRKEKLWGRLAKIAVVLGIIGDANQFATVAVPQIVEYAKIATGNDPIGIYQLRVLRDGTELEVAGAITFGLTDEVRRILDAHQTIHIIHLNSQGGRVGEARELRDLIAARGLTTYTASGCFSACVIAYAAGKQRLIAKDASLGFHQYSFPGMKQQDFKSEYQKDERDWLARGFKQSFITKAFQTVSTDMWEPSHEELYEAGVITGHPDSNEVAITGVQLNDWDKFEREISNDPVFAALKAHERKIYGQLISELRVGLQKGRSQAELRNKMFPVALSIYKKRLPYASDSAMRTVAALLLEQLKILYSIDPDLCYSHLFSEQEFAQQAREHEELEARIATLERKFEKIHEKPAR